MRIEVDKCYPYDDDEKTGCPFYDAEFDKCIINGEYIDFAEQFTSFCPLLNENIEVMKK